MADVDLAVVMAPGDFLQRVGDELVGSTGPVGPAGPTGPAGVAGATGATGPAGAPGPAGPKGDPGVQGTQGPAGPASTVPGPTGPAGQTGPEGPQGPQGASGADSTVPGPQGPAGPAGAQGPPGADSTVPGPAGPTGPAGTTGAQGPAGVAGPPGPTKVSTDANNLATLGTDTFVYAPAHLRAFDDAADRTARWPAPPHGSLSILRLGTNGGRLEWYDTNAWKSAPQNKLGGSTAGPFVGAWPAAGQSEIYVQAASGGVATSAFGDAFVPFVKPFVSGVIEITVSPYDPGSGVFWWPQIGQVSLAGFNIWAVSVNGHPYATGHPPGLPAVYTIPGTVFLQWSAIGV